MVVIFHYFDYCCWHFYWFLHFKTAISSVLLLLCSYYVTFSFLVLISLIISVKITVITITIIYLTIKIVSSNHYLSKYIYTSYKYHRCYYPVSIFNIKNVYSVDNEGISNNALVWCILRNVRRERQFFKEFKLCHLEYSTCALMYPWLCTVHVGMAVRIRNVPSVHIPAVTHIFHFLKHCYFLLFCLIVHLRVMLSLYIPTIDRITVTITLYTYNSTFKRWGSTLPPSRHSPPPLPHSSLMYLFPSSSPKRPQKGMASPPPNAFVSLFDCFTF